jgi:hypothetical protein
MELNTSEIWKAIKGFEGFYEINSLGQVRNAKNNYLRKPKINRLGYLTIVLCKEGIGKTAFIHRLIAEAFIPNPESKKEVNHINGCKLDNSIKNLEWCTRHENMRHASKVGLLDGRAKPYSIKSKLLHPARKIVYQFTKDDQFIKEWPSVNQASRELNIKAENIALCARGGAKSAKGFVWKYSLGLYNSENLTIKTIQAWS